MKRLALLLAALALPVPARCELALLANGGVLHVRSRRLAAGCVELALRDGGSVCLEAEAIRAFLPDELAENPPDAEPRPSRDALRALAVRAARRHGVDPALVLAVIDAESGFEPSAVSPRGASGLMQLMPATAAELGVEDVFDPAQSIDAGVRYLAGLLRRYDGDLERALAAYNAGPGAVARHAGVPPFPETRRYVRAVMGSLDTGSPP